MKFSASSSSRHSTLVQKCEDICLDPVFRKIQNHSYELSLCITYVSNNPVPIDIIGTLPSQIDRIFICSSVNEYFRRGLYQLTDICIFANRPASVSIENLNHLIQHKKKTPHETLILLDGDWEKSAREICNLVSSLSLKISASEIFEESVDSLSSEISNRFNQPKRVPLNEKNLIRSKLHNRLIKKASTSPEKFLEEAILSIRPNRGK